MDIQLSFEPLKLPRINPFGTAYNVVTESDHILVRLRWENIEGLGEAAPVHYHSETADTVSVILQMWQRQNILGDDPFAIAEIAKRLNASIYGNASAKAAVEMALYDLCGQIVGQPIYKMLGLPGLKSAMTSFTIAIDSLDKMEKKTEEALKANHKILKVKLGTQYDKEIIECVRRKAPNLPLRVDANGAWTVKQTIAMSHFLADHQIELIEQPLPKQASYEDFCLVRQMSPVPIFLDESISIGTDVSHFAHAMDGIVVKLAKTGGLLEALKVIFTARSHGVQILLGCMVESSIGITAAAHLAGLVDYLDLDGNLLLAHDPFQGVEYHNGHLKLTERPGLGVISNQYPKAASA